MVDDASHTWRLKAGLRNKDKAAEQCKEGCFACWHCSCHLHAAAIAINAMAIAGYGRIVCRHPFSRKTMSWTTLMALLEPALWRFEYKVDPCSDRSVTSVHLSECLA